MAKLERTAERRDLTLGPLKRVSWGAILSGSILSVAAMLTFGTLAVAVSGADIVPAANEWSLRTLGFAAGLWWVASGVVALFLGGLVTGRLAGFSRRGEGPLHGIITWALTTVTTVALTTSMIVGAGIGFRGSHPRGPEPAMDAPMTGRMGPHRAERPHFARARFFAGIVDTVALAAQTDLPERVWQDIRKEADQLLLASAVKAVVETVVPIDITATQSGMHLEDYAAAKAELDEAIAALYRGAKAAVATGEERPFVTEGDKTNVVDVMMKQINMERQEAERHVDRWATQLEEAWHTAKLGLGAGSYELERRWIDLRGDIHSVSSAAWLTFFYLLLSAIAAGLGGMIGARRFKSRKEPASATTMRAPEEE